jgi:segregation and condensation protein B
MPNNFTSNAQAGQSSSTPNVVQLIEALLFMGGVPLTIERAAEAIRGLGSVQFTETIETLSREYRQQGRPYQIQLKDNGYVVALGPGFKSVEERLYGLNRQARMSPASIDVLSLVAYRQPVAKPEIDAIRGTDSGGILRQLIRRGLVRVKDQTEGSRRETRYATTERFLDLFQLGSLDELPRTEDLDLM